MTRKILKPDGTIVDMSPEEEALRAAEKAERDSVLNHYSTLRQGAYPSIGDQLDMLFKDLRDGTTTFQDTIQAIKDLYPKS